MLQLDKRAATDDAAAGGDLRQGGRHGRRRSAPAGGTLVLLLVLGLFAAVLYVGPIYPSTVQQLHLHLRLPQLAENMEQAALLAKQRDLYAGGGGGGVSTLAFEVCSGFATQRVALVSGERWMSPAQAPAAVPCLRDASSQQGNTLPSSCAPHPWLADWPRQLAHCPPPPHPGPAGIVLAVELNRTMVLPRVVLDGSLPADDDESDEEGADVGDSFSGSVEFG